MESVMGFLPLALFLCLLAWGAMRLSKWSRREQKSDGIGGWVALLALGLILLGPIVGFGRISSEFSDAERLYPSLLTVSKWVNFKTTAWGIFAVGTVFGMYAGWGLLKKREPKTPHMAIIALWVIGPLYSVLLLLVLPFLFFGSADADAQVAGSILSSLIAPIIWTIYLIRSKKVKSIYNPLLAPFAPMV